MAAVSVDYSIQPFSGTDLAALVLAIAAVHCLTIKLRDHEPGMGWFAFSMGLLAEREVVLVWTPRGAARRIVSMRYANEREIAKYSPAMG